MGLGSVLNLIKYRNVVDELYRGLLGREADADGRAHHLNLLRSGVPLSQLISGLVSSDEFRQKNPKSGEEEPEGCSKAEAIAMFAKFEDPDRRPREGFTTNFMGGVVAVNVIDMLGGRSGFVEGYPIPANIQGRTIEWMGTLQSVLDARGSYSIVELGAGWAPWCAAGYVAAKKMGITDISVVAVEGDKGKIAFIRDNFAAHGIDEKATTITYGVVGPFDGFAEFPDLSVDPNINYGLAADFNAAKKDVKMLKVPAFSLKTILAPFDRVDLIHCDVQGAEADVFEAGMDVALAKVKRVVIGTHSLDIERRLIGIFKGWVCEGMTSGEYIVPSILTRDGCQIWRNPNLTS